jgi:putative spermidine/putrescine transport system permease protein
MRRRASACIGKTLIGAVLAFGMLPAVIVAVTSFTSTEYLKFPPSGLSLKWYDRAFADQALRDAFFFSVRLSLVTAVIATVLGTLVAFAVIRYNFRGKGALETFAMGPLTLPRVVLGLALLQVYSSLGMRSSFWTLLTGHVLVTTPFTIRLVSSGLSGVGRTYERAAMSLGASYPATLRHVTLPLAKTGIFAAFVFAAILSFDDVAMSVFLSGIGTTTIPVKLYAFAEQHNTPIVTSVSTILVALGLVGLVVMERTIGIAQAFGSGKQD